MEKPKPHARALRIGRYSEPNRIYVVTAVTRNRAPLFIDLVLGRIVVNALRKEHLADRATTLAYVVMPDHFHWLLQLGSKATLSHVVRAVKGSTARSINLAVGGLERIWQPGFHDHAVRREEDLAGLACYIVANPLRAGLAEDIRMYSLWDSLWMGE